MYIFWVLTVQLYYYRSDKKGSQLAASNMDVSIYYSSIVYVCAFSSALLLRVNV